MDKETKAKIAEQVTATDSPQALIESLQGDYPQKEGEGARAYYFRLAKVLGTAIASEVTNLEKAKAFADKQAVLVSGLEIALNMIVGEYNKVSAVTIDAFKAKTASQ